MFYDIEIKDLKQRPVLILCCSPEGWLDLYEIDFLLLSPPVQDTRYFQKN